MAGRCSAPASEVDGLSDGKGGRHRSFRPVFDEQFDRRAEGAALLARKTGARFEVIRTPQRGARLFGEAFAARQAVTLNPDTRERELRTSESSTPRVSAPAQLAMLNRL